MTSLGKYTMSNKISPEPEPTVINISPTDDVDPWRCVSCQCNDRINEGKKIRKVKHCIRIIGVTIFFIFAAFIFGILEYCLFSNKGLSLFTHFDFIISIIIGLISILVVFYISKCCCCNHDDITLMKLFCN